MDHPNTMPTAGVLRRRHTLAEQYIQKILPPIVQAVPVGSLVYVSVVTKISYTEENQRLLAESDEFDGALSAIIRAELPRLAEMALAGLDALAKATEQPARMRRMGTLVHESDHA